MGTDIKPIHTEADYEAALRQLEKVFDAEPGTPEGDRLEVLTTLIDAYEREHHPIALPDPIDAIRFYMEQNDLSRADLGDLIGSRPRATEILNRERGLSISIIRKLVEAWSIPAEILIRDSRVTAKARARRFSIRHARHRRAHA